MKLVYHISKEADVLPEALVPNPRVPGEFINVAPFIASITWDGGETPDNPFKTAQALFSDALKVLATVDLEGSLMPEHGRRDLLYFLHCMEDGLRQCTVVKQ
jgi:hypothetical protein